MNHRESCCLIFLAFSHERVHAARGVDFPVAADTKRASTSPMPPSEAAAGFRVPDGFRVTTFASEPDVRNPVAMAWDTCGRLWIAENFTYSDQTQRFDLRLRDRVLIFEDADGDGRFERAHSLHRGRSATRQR